MNENKILSLSIDTLLEKYNITNKEEIETLKNGKEFIDSAVKICKDDSASKVCSALIDCLMYKRNNIEVNKQ